MSKSKIEWTEHTWNPIVGCQNVSPGCANCYAVKMAQRLKAMGQVTYQDVVDKNGWTGVYNADGVYETPQIPKKASVIFVCSMSDLFCEAIPGSIIQDVYDIFKQYPQHTFLVCTKRPERIVPVLYDSNYFGAGDSLANVWHLTSVENQEYADKRNPELWRLNEWGDWKLGLSMEPLLGPIDLDRYVKEWIGQVIIGAESGPKRRECKNEHVSEMVYQCKEAGIPCFVKQIHIDGKVSKNPDEWPEDILAARELAWMKTKHAPAGGKDKL